MGFLADATTIGYSDFSSIITAVTTQVNVANIVAVLASVVAIAIGLVFMWWGIRKCVKIIMKAAKKGKLSM